MHLPLSLFTSLVVLLLDRGVQYVFRVSARNVVGYGEAATEWIETPEGSKRNDKFRSYFAPTSSSHHPSLSPLVKLSICANILSLLFRREYIQSEMPMKRRWPIGWIARLVTRRVRFETITVYCVGTLNMSFIDVLSCVHF